MSGRARNLWIAGRLRRLQTAEEDVDGVGAAGRLQPMLAQHADHFGLRQQLIVGADEDGGDGPLHVHRPGDREEAGQLIEALAIVQAMTPERVERPDLRGRPRSCGPIPLATKRNSATSSIGRRETNTSASLTRRRCRRSAPAGYARAPRRSPGIPARPRWRRASRLRATATGVGAPGPAHDPVQRADQVDFGGTDGIALHEIAGSCISPHAWWRA